MKPKGPFKHQGFNEELQDDVFEALFQLPDDGCPDSEQFLRVQVETSGSHACMHLWARSRSGDYEIGDIESVPLSAVTRLLYGAARVRTVRVIEPI